MGWGRENCPACLPACLPVCPSYGELSKTAWATSALFGNLFTSISKYTAAHLAPLKPWKATVLDEGRLPLTLESQFGSGFPPTLTVHLSAQLEVQGLFLNCTPPLLPGEKRKVTVIKRDGADDQNVRNTIIKQHVRLGLEIRVREC